MVSDSDSVKLGIQVERFLDAISLLEKLKSALEGVNVGAQVTQASGTKDSLDNRDMKSQVDLAHRDAETLLTQSGALLPGASQQGIPLGFSDPAGAAHASIT